MRVGVVKNPRSGRRIGRAQWESIILRLRRRFEVLFEETIGPNSAVEQAARMAGRRCEVVIAAGGDGTAGRVMEGLLGTNAALAILPLGTGNDFARTIGIGTRLEQALAAIEHGRRERIDVGRWELDGRAGHFLNVAGCGFDAAVADRVNHGYRFLGGRAAYLAAILGTLFRYRASCLEIEVDGERLTGPAMLCAFANARSYGGGLLVAPCADLQDGLLDLVLVGDLGRAEFVVNFPRVLRGSHLTHPKVTHRTFRHLEVLSKPPVPFLVDGEVLPPGKMIVDVQPAALDVIMPAEGRVPLPAYTREGAPEPG